MVILDVGVMDVLATEKATVIGILLLVIGWLVYELRKSKKRETELTDKLFEMISDYKEIATKISERLNSKKDV